MAKKNTAAAKKTTAKKTTAPKAVNSDPSKEAARNAKIALTPLFEKTFGKLPTNFQTAVKMKELIDAHNASVQSSNQSSASGIQSQIPDQSGTASSIQSSAEGIQPKIDKSESGTSSSIESPEPVIGYIGAGISVVIPYLASAAKGHELMYALRGWAEFFPEAYIVIIGDKPDFTSDEVLHIPGLNLHSQPQLDIASKIMQAIASDLVTEEFIWSNDDIYPINPIYLEDITDLKCVGKLNPDNKNFSPGYADKVRKTKEELHYARYPQWNYSTHTPFYFKKEKMAKVFAKYSPDEKPLLISSLYFNSVFPKEIPAVITGDKKCDFIGYIYRENPDLDVLAQAFQERKFINHNNAGYQVVLPFLEEIFPDKCRFEK